MVLQATPTNLLRDGFARDGATARPGRCTDGPPDARRVVRRPTLAAAELTTARLLLSELVNNAVVHGTGQITLRVQTDADKIRIDVIDEGSGFEHVMRKTSFEELSGRGLQIVDAGSSRWGVFEGTTHVWFELERPGPRLGPE